MRVMRVVHYKGGPLDTRFIVGDQMDARAIEMVAYGHHGLDQRLTKEGLVVTHMDKDTDFEREILNQRGVK